MQYHEPCCFNAWAKVSLLSSAGANLQVCTRNDPQCCTEEYIEGLLSRTRELFKDGLRAELNRTVRIYGAIIQSLQGCKLDLCACPYRVCKSLQQVLKFTSCVLLIIKELWTSYISTSPHVKGKSHYITITFCRCVFDFHIRKYGLGFVHFK